MPCSQQAPSLDLALDNLTRQTTTGDRRNTSHVMFSVSLLNNYVFKNTHTHKDKDLENAYFQFFHPSQDSLSPSLCHHLCPMVQVHYAAPLSFTQYSLQAFYSHTLICTVGWIAFSQILSPALCRSSLLCTNPFLAGDCSGNID